MDGGIGVARDEEDGAAVGVREVGDEEVLVASVGGVADGAASACGAGASMGGSSGADGSCASMSSSFLSASLCSCVGDCGGVVSDTEPTDVSISAVAGSSMTGLRGRTSVSVTSNIVLWSVDMSECLSHEAGDRTR